MKRREVLEGSPVIRQSEAGLKSEAAPVGSHWLHDERSHTSSRSNEGLVILSHHDHQMRGRSWPARGGRGSPGL